MVLSRTRINQAKFLLSIPNSEISSHLLEAQKLIKILNFYYLSPVFLLSGGLQLKQKLEKKYSIKNNPTSCDKFMNVFVLFTDEFFICIAFFVAITLMCVIWLPSWQKSAFNAGYNHVKGTDSYGFPTALDNTCHPPSGYHECRACNQSITCLNFNTSDCKFNHWGEGGCGSPSIYCPLFNANAFNAIKNATQLQKDVYVDPKSFVADTYITYLLYGQFNNGRWKGIICNRTIQGEYQAHWAKIYWILSLLAIFIGGILFYMIMNYCISRMHNRIDDLEPENYRLIRIN